MHELEFGQYVGRLLAFLKAKGADSKTMIWFCIDNGHEEGSRGTAGNFRERKCSIHRGGVRVPGILVWPQMASKASATDGPCGTSCYKYI